MVEITVSAWSEAPSLQAGGSEFAVGDVHGHAELLAPLLDTIRNLAGGRRNAHLTFLGDLVDRGPDSRRCLDLAGQSPDALGVGGVTHLLGNHEQRLRFFLRQDRVLDAWDEMAPLGAWVAGGGSAVLANYAIAWPPGDGDTPESVSARLRAAMPMETLDLLERMVGHRRVGNLLFVHAGIEPSADLDAYLARAWDDWTWETRHQHWCWVRRTFLNHRGDTFADGLVVVHGHCIEDEVMAYLGADAAAEPHRLCHGRLNLDAGSYKTGRVAAAQIEDGRYRVIVAANP